MVFEEYTDYDGLGLARLIRSGQVSVEEVVEAAISRIEICDPPINSVVHRCFDLARELARDPPQRGSFAGVPFLLKDLVTRLAGLELTNGCRFYRGWMPPRSSEIVDRFLRAGVIPLGSSNAPELGLSVSTEPELHGSTRNPWDPSRSVGGSSGGAAAAVAARLVPMAAGSDGGGSIRVPASCCGVFGFKPTRGLTPCGPDQPEEWHGLAVTHVLTRSVRDCAAMLDAVAGPYAGDFHFLPSPARSFLSMLDKTPRRLRIAFTVKPFMPGAVHADCVAAVEGTVERLRDLGHDVIPVELGLDAMTLARSYLIVVSAHIAAAIRDGERALGRRARRRDFEPATWLCRASGRSHSAEDYVTAMTQLQRSVHPLQQLLEQHDALLTPTVAEPPPPLGFDRPSRFHAMISQLVGRLPIGPQLRKQSNLDQVARETFRFMPFTPLFNITGQPSMSVPLCWNVEGLPIGVMLSARRGADGELLRLGAQLEEAFPWEGRSPPLSA